MSDQVLASTARHLDAVLARAQAHGRAPSVVAALGRGGDVVWVGSRGRAVRSADGTDGRADPATQYRVGSITKTFTAALVLQLREEGLIGDLTDTLGTYVADAPFPDATIRGLLSHAAGLPAEPAGPWWERSVGGSWEALTDANRTGKRVLPVGERYHYSNLAYGLLGRLVESLRGAAWRDVLAERILEPLRMGRTSYDPTAPHACGFAVEDLTGVLVPEPLQDTGAMAPAGQLWSTVGDLVTWLHELARPTLLSPEAVTAMATPQSADPEEVGGAYGLGLRLVASGGRAVVGHSGSMPGFLAAAYVDRAADVQVAVLANGGYGFDLAGVRDELLATLAAHEPPLADEWTPTRAVGAQERELLGTWHWGHQPATMRVLDGRLALAAEGGRAFTFEPAGPDTWVGRSGYQDGETMRVVRRDDGSISHLDIGTFCYTRIPYDPSVPVPGAGDERS